MFRVCLFVCSLLINKRIVSRLWESTFEFRHKGLRDIASYCKVMGWLGGFRKEASIAGVVHTTHLIFGYVCNFKSYAEHLSLTFKLRLLHCQRGKQVKNLPF